MTDERTALPIIFLTPKVSEMVPINSEQPVAYQPSSEELYVLLKRPLLLLALVPRSPTWNVLALGRGGDAFLP